LSAKREKEVHCAKGLTIKSDYSFENCPALDYLLIPGGQGTRNEVGNEALLAYVKMQSASCISVLSVCTGVFILHAANLIHNKKVTTHWQSLSRLRNLVGENVVDTRYVRDGNIWSAAGVSAGIDLALAFIAENAGEDIASKVQLAVEYYPELKKYGKSFLAPDAPKYIMES
jgi:transcriptional regulator GlxA family with amidase domain